MYVKSMVCEVGAIVRLDRATRLDSDLCCKKLGATVLRHDRLVMARFTAIDRRNRLPWPAAIPMAQKYARWGARDSCRNEDR